MKLHLLGNHARVANDRAVTVKERSGIRMPETTDQTSGGLLDPVCRMSRSVIGTAPCSHGSVIGDSDSHGRPD